MRLSKKVFIIAIAVAVVLVGSIAGVVLAKTDNNNEDQVEYRHEAMLERVCEIYKENTGVAIEPQELKNAFTQAGKEARDDALESLLDKLVDEGRITDKQAEEYLKWWDSRPDDMPFQSGLRGHGGFRGFGGFGSFRGFCEPPAE